MLWWYKWDKEQLKPSWLLIPICHLLNHWLPAADFLNEFKVALKNNNDQLTTAADFIMTFNGFKEELKMASTPIILSNEVLENKI